MNYRYIKNLRDSKATKVSDVSKLKRTVPSFANKQKYREWCSDANTDHVFFNACEGRAPAKRISNDNPVNKVYGVVADYDAAVDWKSLHDNLAARFGINQPTWLSKRS